MTTSVLIVTWNNERTILSCLESIGRSHVPVDEVLVFDNASCDQTVALCRDALGASAVVASQRNRGFAAGVNALASRATGDLLVLVNPDVVVETSSLALLAETSHRLDRCIVGGAVSDGESPVQAASGRPFTPWWRLVVWLLGGRNHRWHVPVVEQTVDAVSGAFMLIPHDVWAALTGFDESFKHSGEDLDLCWRAGAASIPVIFQPAALANHEVGASVAQAPATIEALRWHGVLRFIEKREGRGPALAVRCALRIRTRIALIAAASRVRRCTTREHERAQILNGWAGGRLPLPTLPDRPERTA